MKRILSLALLTLMLFSGFAGARCKYDSKGHLIYDDTIRGRRRAALQAKLEQQTKIQAAAAAKLDINKSIEELDEKPVKKSNYIQSRNTKPRNLPDSTLKSNYVQSLDK